ncbi:ankyrin 3 [Legionella busanensis]|uniref:Ankyrin 3 n=1 Tax=Legionella busanensis TaxID=190655 RepID=A0A378JV58_9GAMM|nr:ankyrin repeat domain-containing protein [Legionella busanensis]STX52092.1 ankyrin 3 [Legionella busanensis]
MTTPLKLYQALNHSPDTDGVCVGFALRAIEAGLIGELSQFDERNDYIDNKLAETLVDEIDLVRNKVSALARAGTEALFMLNEQERMRLDILGFYDSLNIYQNVKTWCFLVGQTNLNQNYFEAMSVIASSDAILARGGLVTLYSEALIKDKVEIITYLIELEHELKRACIDNKAPLGFLLENEDHAVALIYTPNIGWSYRDVSQDPLDVVVANDDPLDHANHLLEVVEAISMGFVLSANAETNTYAAFNIKLVLTKKDSRCNLLKETLTAFKHTHVVTKQLASRRANSINLLWLAASFGHVSLVEELIDQGTEVNIADSDGDTPLLMALKNHYLQVASYLIASKANVNLANNDGITPLHMAANFGHLPLIKQLTDEGAKVNVVDNDGLTPLHTAAREGQVEISKYLIQAGADLFLTTKLGNTPLSIAAANNDLAIVKRLIKYFIKTKNVAALNLTANEYKITLLHLSAAKGHSKVAQGLIELGADVNVQDCNGATPLLIAALKNYLVIVKHLIKAGANLNLASNNGATSLYVAAERGHIDVVKVLLDAGADSHKSCAISVDTLAKLAETKPQYIQTRIAFLLRKSSTANTVAVTPYEIATIMGHTDVASEIVRRIHQLRLNTAQPPSLGLFFQPNNAHPNEFSKKRKQTESDIKQLRSG